jgi:hypothetical protein
METVQRYESPRRGPQEEFYNGLKGLVVDGKGCAQEDCA